MPLVLAAPDKFRGTASARDITAAVARIAADKGWECDEAPVADGGEGLLDVLGGGVRTATVMDPLGRQIEAEWRMRDDAAVIEMARASGLALVGGADGNDPIAASTAGTGQLIAAAVNAGAKRVIVGMGGSATTDGGRGCLEVLEPHARLRGIELLVACDVMTRFVDAAEVFGPQKGASPAQVELLKRRLERLAQIYEEDLGVDVRDLPGSGAAGGLAGGLAALGADLLPGFELVAEQIDLAGRMEHADLVITGEGYLDDQSFNGKAVGGVLGLAREFNVPCLVICGDSDPGTPVPVLNLVSRYGEERAMGDTIGCIEEIATEWLEGAGEDIRLHGRIGGGRD